MESLIETERLSAAKLRGRVVPRAQVNGLLSERLFQLFSHYYLHVDRASFERDQAEKDWVLLLDDAHGIVQGFTTLKLYELTVLGRPVRALFSGNTIIDQAYWGETELVAAWCRFMARLKREALAVPLYWFLISSGYRTYLYLPLFFHDFFPRHDRATSEFEQTLIDTLGRRKFPDEYRDGVVHVARPRECLRPELALPRATKRANPHVSFFFEKNPNCLRGDELVCVTEFSLANTRRLAYSAARAILEDGHG